VRKTLHRPPSTPGPEEDALVATSSPSNISLTTKEFELEVREKTVQRVASDLDTESFLEEFEFEVTEKTVQEKSIILKLRSSAKHSPVPLQSGELEFEEEEEE